MPPSATNRSGLLASPPVLLLPLVLLLLHMMATLSARLSVAVRPSFLRPLTSPALCRLSLFPRLLGLPGQEAKRPFTRPPFSVLNMAAAVSSADNVIDGKSPVQI